MNRPAGTMESSATVDLAATRDFSIGGLQVRPALREIVHDGRSVLVEPRAMQVLVALVQADGDVVSRDTLIARCWGGRAVGDDAINRAIAKVRALGELGGKAWFEIETITRVGYRLKPVASLGDQAAADSGTTAVGRPNRIWLGVAGFALVVVLALVAVTRHAGPPPRWTVVHSQVIASSAAMESHPEISPDGTMLAYSAGPDASSRHIFLRRIAGGEPLKLTDSDWDEASPSWSPDGSRIAYVTFKEGVACRLRVIAVPAGPSREAGRCRGAPRTEVRWSRTEDALFYADRDGAHRPYHLMRLDLHSGQRSEVTHPPPGTEDDPALALSPDGRFVSFNRSRSRAESALVIRDLTSGEERVLTSDPAFGRSAWSEDSQGLFVVGNGGSRDFGLWFMALDGSPPERLTFNTGEIFRIAAGPKGLMAAEVPVSKMELVSISTRPESVPSVVEVADEQQFVQPDLGPDGTLTYLGNRFGEFGIWVRSPDGRYSKLVSLKPFGDFAAAGYGWSPDRSMLAYVPTAQARQSIEIVSATGMPVASVRFAGLDISGPAWSGDGKSVLFGGRDARGWRLWRAPLAQPDRLVPLSGYGWDAPMEDAGTLYAVKTDAGGVWRLGPEPKRLTPGPAHDLWGDFSLHEQEIFYVDYGTRIPRLMAQPIAGGPPRVAGAMPGYSPGVGYGYDRARGQIAYVAGHGDRDIVLMRLERPATP